MVTKIILGKFNETHCQASNVKSKSKTSQKRHSAPFDISIKLNYKLQQVSSVCTANLG